MLRASRKSIVVVAQLRLRIDAASKVFSLESGVWSLAKVIFKTHMVSGTITIWVFFGL